MGTPQSTVILCAENNPDDAYLVQRAARGLGLQFDIRFVPDCRSAKEWISGEGSYSNRDAFPMPDCLVADLKMPSPDGLDLLRWVRNHPQTEELPVIIHSASQLPDDIISCHLLGATHYIHKDPSCARLVHYLKLWFTDGPLES
jgi:CheY-like chemotaxis protein